MDKVYLLWHMYDRNGGEEAKLLGAYSSREKAEAKIPGYRALPGFCNHPDDFLVDEYEMDQPMWTEGFVTMYPDEEQSPESER